MTEDRKKTRGKTVKGVLFCIVYIVVGILPVSARGVTVSSSVSTAKIGVGEQMTLTVTVSGSSQKVPKPAAPRIPGVSVYSAGTSSSVSIINGAYSVSKEYSYTLVPQKQGKFTIPASVVTFKGKKYRSQPVTVTVVKGATRRQPSARQPKARQGNQRQIFIKATVDRVRAYVNQQVTVTYELYSNVNLSGVSFKEPPQFTGCWSEDLKVPKKQSQTMVTIKGQRFLKVILQKTALFPLTAGKVSIKPVSVIVSIDNFRNDPFAGFFSRRMGRTERQQLNSNALSITVKPIPAKGRPADYTGSIGSFSISSKTDKNTVKAGEPVTLSIDISGVGNIKTISEPELPVVGDFERYDSGSDVKIYNRNYRVQGHKKVTYVLIPKSAGKHEIGSIPLSYFDPAKGRYITKRTKAHTITATPGDKADPGRPMMITGLSKENLKVLDKDIRFIKSAPYGLKNAADAVYTRTWFLLLQLVPLAVFAGLLLYRRQADMLEQNVGMARSRRAHRMAKKRVNQARKLLKGGATEQFCGEVSRALTEFLGDKLNIAATGTTTDRIADILEEKNVARETIDRFKKCFEFCDYGRFAPSAVKSEDMERNLAAAEEAIVILDKEKLG